MNARITEILAPPLATYRRGAAAICTGPIAVFWLAALVSIGYGIAGGPLGVDSVNWWLIGLGLLMWAISSTWAVLVLKGQAAGVAAATPGNEASKIQPERYEEDPFEEVK